MHPEGHLAWGGSFAAIGLAVALAVLAWTTLILAPRPQASGASRWVEGALAALGLGVIVALIAKPVWVEASGRTIPGRTVVLVDASSSLGVAERGVLRSTEAARRAAGVDGERVEVFHFGGDLRTGMPPRYDLGQTDVGGALEAVSERYVGERLDAVVLITDGIDRGALRAEHAAGRPVVPPTMPGPLTVVAVGTPGSLRDLSVVRADSGGFAYAHTPMTLRVEVRGEGHPGRVVPVELTRDGAVVATVATTLDAEGLGEAVFTVTPDKAGRIAWLVRVPDDADDAVPANNSLPVVVSVVRDRLRVLQVAGTPTWDVKFLRRFLKGDPSVDLVSFFILRTPEDEINQYDDSELSLIPFPYEQLFDGEISTFDVVVFQNFNHAPFFGRNGPKLLANLRDFVSRDGHGLMMVGGDRSFSLGGYAESPLAEILPVALPPSPGEADVAPFQPTLTEAGLRHPITRLLPDEAETAAWWGRLHAMDGANVVGDALPGATVLLTHPARTTPSGAPMPVLAAREVGAGRTVALTVDASWRWSVSEAAAGAGNQAYLRLWKNALRWVVGDAATSRLAAEVPRENYAPDDDVPITVRARTADMQPAANAAVQAEISVEGEVTTVTGTTDATGAWTTPWKATRRGTHTVRAQWDDGVQALSASTMFTVTARDPELDDVMPDAGFLRALADAAGGRFVGVGEALDVLRDPQATRMVSERHEVDLARTPWVALVAAAALGGATWVRRRGGLR